MSSYMQSVTRNFSPNQNENVLQTIFKQYEFVVVQSLITSFGLDFLVSDRHGGDVDTIHNVRQIGKDAQMEYKDTTNNANYLNHGSYDSHEYHSHKKYIEKNREVSYQKKNGTLKDAYTGKKIAFNEKTDLDHTIAAAEIHDDRGRVLSGLNGADLANSDENLNPTNPHTNRTKKADSMDKFLEKYGDEYTENEKANMREKDEISRKSYEAKLAKAYYTSPKFAKDVAVAAGKVSVKMGLRQALGLVFTEIWFSVKQEFESFDKNSDFGDFFTTVGKGVKKGFLSAKLKYKDIFAKFLDGAVAGALSSITTTLCNIFFTTGKNVVKIIRQSYASLVEATKILLINPDNYPFGERIRATAKVVAAGASVVVGGLVNEAIGKTPLGAIPIVGDIVQTFCGTLVTGIMSCTLLYFIDRSVLMNRLVEFLNNIPTVEGEIAFFNEQARIFEEYAAKLLDIDIDKFKRETEVYNRASVQLELAKDDKEVNEILKQSLQSIGISIPWAETHDNFDDFMNDSSVTLRFE